MLNDDGIENGKKNRKKQTNQKNKATTTTIMISPISKKKTTTTLQVQHTSFLYISLPLLLHDYNVKLSSYTFYGGNVVCSHKKIAACVPIRFLFQCLLFSPYWLLTFRIFTPPP